MSHVRTGKNWRIIRSSSIVKSEDELLTEQQLNYWRGRRAYFLRKKIKMALAILAGSIILLFTLYSIATQTA
jgi:hypothetical protein